MADNELLNLGYSVDPVTGFLEKADDPLNPRVKTAFLKAFKRSGDATASIEELSVSNLALEQHLKYDEAFRKALHSVRLAMKHRLEGLLFKSGLQPNGHRDRVKWLEKNFPEEYGPKAKGFPKEKKKTALDVLWDESEGV